jgi:hypothetical protein
MKTLQLEVDSLNIIIWMKTVLASLLILLSVALAQDLPEGSELLLTDLDSQVIVGHGKVFAGELYLKVSQDASGFFLYVVSPDGHVATHHGEAQQNLIGVFGDDGELLDLTQVLAGRGVILHVERIDMPQNPSPSDDALLQTTEPKP